MPRESPDRGPDWGDASSTSRAAARAAAHAAAQAATHAAAHAARVAEAEARDFVTHWTRILHEDWMGRDPRRRDLIDASQDIAGGIATLAGTCIPNLVITWPRIEDAPPRPGVAARTAAALRVLATLFVRGAHVLASLARRAVERSRERSRVRALRSMLEGFDDQTLRDLGIERDDIASAAELAVAEWAVSAPEAASDGNPGHHASARALHNPAG